MIALSAQFYSTDVASYHRSSWAEAQNWWSAKSARCVSCIKGCRCFETVVMRQIGALLWLSNATGVRCSFVPVLCTVWCIHTKVIHIYWQLRRAGFKRDFVMACQSGIWAPFHLCHSWPTKNARMPQTTRRHLICVMPELRVPTDRLAYEAYPNLMHFL